MVVDPRRFRRINVVGTSGSGKTTYSKKLAEVLSVPYIEMDAIFWGPNWQWPRDDEFFFKLTTSLEIESWVLDGNYTRTTPIKWAKVDCVIWLDFPFWKTVSRVLRRAVKRAITREEIWQGTGNRESLRKCFFSKESIVLWAIKTYSKNKQKYEAMMNDPKYRHIEFVRVRSTKDGERLLRQFQGH